MQRPWREEDPGLPIKLNPCSNGEFVPPPPSPLVREVARRTREQAERTARRLGMSRREFLLSSAGSALMLSVLAACSSEKDEAEGNETGGTFTVPEESTTSSTAAREALGAPDFVFDVQGHFLELPAGSPVAFGFPQLRCGEEDSVDCLRFDKFMDLIFRQSDTSMIVLSSIGLVGGPLSQEHMDEAKRIADELCGEGRVLMQGAAQPSVGSVEEALANMERVRDDFPISAWKVYCHSGAPGWWLDDHDPAVPQVGKAFLDKVEELGPNIVAVHKGFAGIGIAPEPEYAHPMDVGPAAAAHPDINFVVYHSGFDVGPAEGAYDPDNDRGVDRFLRSLESAGIGPNGNVYAELGGTWRTVMGDPNAAAHVLGKLLKHVGEDRVVWGTDSIWFGTPQDQIEAFRAFEITPALQEEFGYPALTPEIKAKILGGTSAALYGVEPPAAACTLEAEQVEELRLTSLDRNRTFGPVTAKQVKAVFDHHTRGHWS